MMIMVMMMTIAPIADLQPNGNFRRMADKPTSAEARVSRRRMHVGFAIQTPRTLHDGAPLLTMASKDSAGSKCDDPACGQAWTRHQPDGGTHTPLSSQRLQHRHRFGNVHPGKPGPP